MRNNNIFLLLLLSCLFTVPVNAEQIHLEDSAGSDTYTVVNEKFDIRAVLENGATSVVGIDRYSSEQDTFTVSNPGDSIAQIDFELSVDADTGNETIPFSISNGEKREEFYLKITKERSYGTLLTNLTVSLYTANDDFLMSKSGTCLFFEYFQVTINRIGYGMFNDKVDYGLMPVYDDYTIGSLLPARELTIDISGSQNQVLCRLHIYDDTEYSEEDDSGYVMGLYWLIESVIGDPDNVLYTYFQVADMYYSWVTWVILLVFSAPCMYVMFAGVCGLASCILNGSFKGGVSAGLRTFITLMKYPFTIVKYLFVTVYAFASGVIKAWLR